MDIKKTNYGSTTLEVFLFNHRRKLSFLWQVYSSLSATLPWKSNTSLISLDTFPRRAHFVIMDFLRNRTGKQFYMKLGTLAVKGIDLHKFSFPNSSPVRLGSVCANILGRLLDDSWQDNRLPSTRDLGYSLPNLPPIHRLAAGDRYGRAQDIRNTKISPKNISYIHDRYCGAEFKIFLRNSKISAYILGQEPLRR